MWYGITVLFIVTTILHKHCIHCSIETLPKAERTVKHLQGNLKLPVLQTNFFLTNFSTHNLLKLNDATSLLGIEFDGSYSSQMMENVFDKAIRGENISVLVLGGSATQGADLGYQSPLSTFHYGLKNWWDSVIAPVSGSYMNRRVVAIGGTGTTYMSLCWKEYIKNFESIDLILWEFFINDPDSENYADGVEKFIKSVLNYPTEPTLILLRFFKKNLLLKNNLVAKKVNGFSFCKTHAMKSGVLKKLSVSYKITMLNVLLPLCNLLKLSRISISENELFAGNHPSHLAHAQLAFILINHVKLKFKRYSLSSIQIKTSHIKTNKYKELKTICWTAVSPSTLFKTPHSIFQLPSVQNYGFHKMVSTPWNQAFAVRRDIRGGYMSSRISNNRLILSLKSPAMQQQPYTVYTAISHQVDGGTTYLQVQSNIVQNTIQLDCSRRKHASMDINRVIDRVSGDIQLQMESPFGSCLLNAIILEYDPEAISSPWNNSLQNGFGFNSSFNNYPILYT